MIFGNYRFHCQVEEEAVLPPYKGSTFRGVFGHALRKTVCVLKTRECRDCLLLENCLYPYVFEDPQGRDDQGDTRISSRPHPFVIEPPLTTTSHLPKGAAFDFSLMLFGEINRKLPYFIYAFEQMGRIGIGRRINGRRGTFHLNEVKSGDCMVYSGLEQKLRVREAWETIRLKEMREHDPEVSQIRLSFLTPLRLKFQNHLQAELPFHVLVRAMLRRVSSLFNAYGEGEPDLDYRGLVFKAEDVRVGHSTLQWFDWRRYSTRQDQAMLMGGLTGSVTYEGLLGEFMPLLDFCARVHIGKQTTFGLGQFLLEVLP